LLALDTRLSRELVLEGLARELINRIQNLRKESQLEVSDRIRLALSGDDDILAAVEAHRERIQDETLAVKLEFRDGDLKAGSEFTIDGHRLAIGLEAAID
jgi:isoleucyl-tRNA synthetase